MARLTLILGVLATVVYLLDGFRFMLNEWRNWRNKGTWLVVVVLCCVPSVAEAACTGASPTWTCGTTRDEIVNLVNTNTPAGFVSGDTVNVAAGTDTWSTNIVFNKVVKLIGAGIGQTNITLNASPIRLCTDNTGARLSGFSFNTQTNFVELSHCQGFRIDHNSFIRTTSWNDLLQIIGSSTIADEGVIDHNTFEQGRIVEFGQATGASGAGRHRWSEALNWGTVSGVYIEDNVFNNFTAGNVNNSIDGNQGSRMIVRFNTFHSARLEQHSVQSQGQRAVRLWEFYGNDIDSTDHQNYRPFFIRGGTGVVFHNRYDGGMTVDSIDIDNIRSQQQADPGLSFPDWGWCDGLAHSVTVDEDTPTYEGWRCRDQIGTSTDASLWDYTNPAPAQQHQPAYIWRNPNTATGLNTPVGLNCYAVDIYCTRQSTSHLIENRDWYPDSTATGTPQTVGTREGTLATMQAITTCTEGVGFWATDQGSWNTSTSNPYGVQANGEDGVLYVCGASNNWNVAYTPYTYPHPLNTPEDVDAPLAASPVVISRVLRWMEVAAFVTGMGWHFRKPIMAVSLAVLSWTVTIGHLTPRAYDTMKVAGKESAIKVLTVLNDMTKPRV